MTPVVEENYDVIVVGAGHAGCEAALSCARLGLETIVFTVSVDSIALMPCNPNVGGTSKGHLVRELDALGGEMGHNIDKTFIQSKMLNESKGPAVHSLRAQADKQAYTREMRKTLEKTEHLTIRQAEVSEIITEEVPEKENQIFTEAVSENRTADSREAENREAENRETESGKADNRKTENRKAESRKTENREAETGKTDHGKAVIRKAENAGEKDATRQETIRICRGVKTVSGAVYHAKAVILATGVYLNARCIFGEISEYTGPNGLKAANHLTDSLKKNGIIMYRFKTGTPARVDGRTIDYTKMEEQKGDVPIVPFSFDTDPESIQKEQVSCFLTHTGKETHDIIRKNIDRSPLYNGSIHSTGPRYCPSIEDKVMKFPDKEGHQIFVEPEGLYTHEMYLGGMSSSLPEDVQYAMIHTVPGLEHARVVRNAYAIEYDCIDARQLTAALEFKKISGLFAGGQFNGSSGYEEAAVQGFMAGVNAAMKIQGREPVVIDRSEGYIGVLIDDLVTKESHEPYRMMTSRSEYRLLLRQDNADLRLSETGHRIGLVSDEKYGRTQRKKQLVEEEVRRLKDKRIGATKEIQEWLAARGSSPLKTGVSLSELVCRPELSYSAVQEIDPERPVLTPDAAEQVNINIKYEGYIRRQEQQVKQFKKMEGKLLPPDIDYRSIESLRLEAVQKLNLIKPRSIGQASRISGVSPADITVLLVWLAAKKP